LLTPRQVAERLAVSPRTVYLWIEEGRLPSVRLSERVTRVPEEAVDALVASALRPAIAPAPAQEVRAAALGDASLAAEAGVAYQATKAQVASAPRPASGPETHSERLWALLQQHRAEIIEIVERNKGANVRVFGSVVHGDATESSDIDLLIDGQPGMSYFDMARIGIGLESLLGRKVDLGIADSLRVEIRERVLGEAKPL
jgi:excisionase family DNA binding protein